MKRLKTSTLFSIITEWTRYWQMYLPRRRLSIHTFNRFIDSGRCHDGYGASQYRGTVTLLSYGTATTIGSAANNLSLLMRRQRCSGGYLCGQRSHHQRSRLCQRIQCNNAHLEYIPELYPRYRIKEPGCHCHRRLRQYVLNYNSQDNGNQKSRKQLCDRIQSGRHTTRRHYLYHKRFGCSYRYRDQQYEREPGHC